MKLRNLIVCAIYALFVLPACASNKHRVAIVCHRGYWNCEAGGFSHNSIASLRQAQCLDFWGSEFDVNMTKDGELMVFHDDAVAGMKFCEHDAAEFAGVKLPNGEKIPTLDEYLEQFEKKKCRLVFELKSHAYDMEEKAVDLSIQKLKEHGLYDSKRVVFISFSKHECELFAKKCPGFIVQYLDSDIDPDAVHELGINGVDTHFKTFYNDPDWIEKARRHNMSVNAWTVDNVEDMRKIIELGADYITTNNPELARSLLKEMRVKELKAGKNF